MGNLIKGDHSLIAYCPIYDRSFFVVLCCYECMKCSLMCTVTFKTKKRCFLLGQFVKYGLTLKVSLTILGENYLSLLSLCQLLLMEIMIVNVGASSPTVG